MQTRISILCCFALTMASVAQDSFKVTGKTYEEAVNKMMDHLKDQQTATARANYAAACISTTRAVKRKSVTIFAVHAGAKTGSFKEGDLDVEVVFNRDIAEGDPKAAGAYYQHSNAVVLSYAAFEYASGNRELGLRLVRRLIDAHPNLGWSSPTHPEVSLKEILSGLEKGDGSITKYVKEDSDWWTSRVKEFGR